MQTTNLATLDEFINGRFGGGNYNRLGDCEIAVLRAWDLKIADNWSAASAPKTGLLPHNAQDLRYALENTTFLDLCLNQSINKKYISSVELSLKNKYINNSDNGNLIRKWIFDGRLKNVLSTKKVLFVGAEAELLSNLTKFSDFLDLAKDFFPKDISTMRFYTPYDYGKNIDRNLSQILIDLDAEIKNYSHDTLLISLGGHAKIVTTKLAQSHPNLTFIDFGSNLRTLTASRTRFDLMRADYCGWPGYLVPSSIVYGAISNMHAIDASKAIEIIANNLLFNLSWRKVGHGEFRIELTEENKNLFKSDFNEVQKKLSPSQFLLLEKKLIESLAQLSIKASLGELVI